MAGPVAVYSATQSAAQTAFNVPFGLITQVTTAINNATAAGLFNTTVDCSLFVTEDVSNLRIYLDSEGYLVEYAKNSGNKSLLIDWGRPNSAVASSGTPALLDTFGRIKNKQFKDTETVLYDIPLTFINVFIYTGVATKGSSQTATVWNIIRSSFDANGNPSADQIALGIAWSARAAGPWS